jgi:hypothetical protein
MRSSAYRAAFSRLISLTFRSLQELLRHGIGGRSKKLMAAGVQVIVGALGFRTEQIHSSQRVGTNGNRSTLVPSAIL